MKVLSIDLDFISSPAINKLWDTKLIEEMAENDFDEQPVIKWRQTQELHREQFRELCNEIDVENYQFCLRTFIRAFAHCQDVHFGYDHDSILFGLEDHTDIEIVNIDHHSDILTGEYDDPRTEMYWVDKEERVTEGNWGYYLQSQGRLKSWHWILNRRSEEWTDTELGEDILNNFSWSMKEDYDFGDYKFDQIFICLSPGYIPPLHWHMMATFMAIYEEGTGNKINEDDLHRKYEMKKYYKGVTDIIRTIDYQIPKHTIDHRTIH